MNETRRRGWTGLALFVSVSFAAGWYFASAKGGVASEPPFADEAAVLAQTRYYQLAVERRFSDPDWVDHAAYDHQPLYKYLIGFGLHVTGQYDRIPNSLDEFHRWINGGVRAPEVDRRLIVARWTMLLGSACSVGFLFLFVRSLCGTAAGLIAAAAFVSSPLVFAHARRAMIDLPAVGLCLGSLWAALAFAKSSESVRSKIALAVAFVLLCALAPLAKWNAASGVIASALAGLVVLIVGGGRLVGLVILVCVAAAAALFVGLDPYYWSTPEPQALSQRLQSVPPPIAAEYRKLAPATPWERGKHALDYRRATMASAKASFPNDYLSPAERLPAVALQGMGRWTLANRPYSVAEAERPRSERNMPRDWFNAAVLLPLAVIGVVSSTRRGWAGLRSGEFPFHWLLVAWVGIELVILATNLTLDWDRYYLGVVAWSSVAAAVGLHALIRGFVSQLRLNPRELTPT